MRPTSLIVLAASSLLILWGGSMLVDGQSAGATPMATISQLRLPFLIVLLLAAGGGGVLECFRQASDGWSMVLMAPQVGILFMAALDCASAIINGYYADGTPRPHGFIFRDQILCVNFVFWYAVAMVWTHIQIRREKHQWTQQ